MAAQPGKELLGAQTLTALPPGQQASHQLLLSFSCRSTEPTSQLHAAPALLQRALALALQCLSRPSFHPNMACWSPSGA